MKRLRMRAWLFLADALFLFRLNKAALWATLRAARLVNYEPIVPDDREVPF